MSSHLVLVEFAAAKTVYIPFYRNMTLTSAKFVSTASVTKDGSNYFELRVYANDATEVMATWQSSSSGQDFTGGTPVSKTLANTDEGDFSASQVCKVEAATTGSGAIAGILMLEFSDARSY